MIVLRSGDMVIFEEPSSAKFIKALQVIANVLHPAFESLLPTPGKSKESCVLCSLTVRDFLHRIGFKGARVTTVYLALVAHDAEGNEVHSAGCGDHLAGRVPTMPGVKPARETPGYWNGHMVVEVPSVGYLIDTTLAPMWRKQWPKLPGMMAVPTFTDGLPAYGMERMSGIESDQGNGNTLQMIWLREPNEGWRSGGDATNKELRRPVVLALRSAFGKLR